tara:strand:+ start:83 stop:472 length:390 start_codon:yes stop_codon:yes gene_type:complete
MNKVYIETSVGELLDKITILEIKKDKVTDEKNLKMINKEYLSLKDSMNKVLKINKEILNLTKELKEVNLKLWEVEDNKRLAEKNKKFDDNFIELSRNVYRFNDLRAKIKSKINELSGSNIKEIKQYIDY